MVLDFESDSTVFRDRNWIFVAEFIRDHPDTYNVDHSVKPSDPFWFALPAADGKKK